jgi:hypothetical protein
MGRTIALEPLQEAGEAHSRALAITLPLPDHALSLNGRGHWRAQRAGQRAQHEVALLAGLATIPARLRPRFPLPARLMVDIDVERRARGKVWDAAAVIEACKGYFDGLNGLAWGDDVQVSGFRVRFDKRPTGRGLVHLYIYPRDRSREWPAVGWETL